MMSFQSFFFRLRLIEQLQAFQICPKISLRIHLRTRMTISMKANLNKSDDHTYGYEQR